MPLEPYEEGDDACMSSGGWGAHGSGSRDGWLSCSLSPDRLTGVMISDAPDRDPDPKPARERQSGWWG
jgi:hypothetical protein